MSESEDHALCDVVLGHVRGAAADLVPAPNDDLDTATLDWTNFAESMFFECPLRSGEHSGWSSGYRELDRLSAVLEALIAFERSIVEREG